MNDSRERAEGAGGYFTLWASTAVHRWLWGAFFVCVCVCARLRLRVSRAFGSSRRFWALSYIRIYICIYARDVYTFTRSARGLHSLHYACCGDRREFKPLSLSHCGRTSYTRLTFASCCCCVCCVQWPCVSPLYVCERVLLRRGVIFTQNAL